MLASMPCPVLHSRCVASLDRGVLGQVRCAVLTSGTLAPLASFAEELRLGQPLLLENPHVIQPCQAWVGVVPAGPRGQALNSSHAQRDNKAYKEDLGNAIANFSRQAGALESSGR